MKQKRNAMWELTSTSKAKSKNPGKTILSSTLFFDRTIRFYSIPFKEIKYLLGKYFSIFPWSLTFTTRFSRIPHKTLAYRWTCYADYNFLETGSYWHFGTQHIVILIKCQVQCLKHVSDIGQKLPWCDQDCCHLMYYRNNERNMSCVKMISLENLL